MFPCDSKSKPGFLFLHDIQMAFGDSLWWSKLQSTVLQCWYRIISLACASCICTCFHVKWDRHKEWVIKNFLGLSEISNYLLPFCFFFLWETASLTLGMDLLSLTTVRLCPQFALCFPLHGNDKFHIMKWSSWTTAEQSFYMTWINKMASNMIGPPGS